MADVGRTTEYLVARDLGTRNERGLLLECSGLDEAFHASRSRYVYRREGVARRARARCQRFAPDVRWELVPCDVDGRGHWHVRRWEDGPWRRPMPGAPGATLPWTPQPVIFSSRVATEPGKPSGGTP